MLKRTAILILASFLALAGPAQSGQGEGCQHGPACCCLLKHLDGQGMAEHGEEMPVEEDGCQSGDEHGTACGPCACLSLAPGLPLEAAPQGMASMAAWLKLRLPAPPLDSFEPDIFHPPEA